MFTRSSDLIGTEAPEELVRLTEQFMADFNKPFIEGFESQLTEEERALGVEQLGEIRRKYLDYLLDEDYAQKGAAAVPEETIAYGSWERKEVARATSRRIHASYMDPIRLTPLFDIVELRQIGLKTIGDVLTMKPSAIFLCF